MQVILKKTFDTRAVAPLGAMAGRQQMDIIIHIAYLSAEALAKAGSNHKLESI